MIGIAILSGFSLGAGALLGVAAAGSGAIALYLHAKHESLKQAVGDEVSKLEASLKKDDAALRADVKVFVSSIKSIF